MERESPLEFKLVVEVLIDGIIAEWVAVKNFRI
jgi:hypothetical protein